MPRFTSYNPFGTEIDLNEISSTTVSQLGVPIGAIIPWLKDLSGVPTMPSSYMECDGSTVNDADSPLNAVTLPNLTNKFLMGSSASGSTGGVSSRGVASDRAGDTGSDAGGFGFTSSATQDNKPPYYTVVFIIRIK